MMHPRAIKSIYSFYVAWSYFIKKMFPNTDFPKCLYLVLALDLFKHIKRVSPVIAILLESLRYVLQSGFH